MSSKYLSWVIVFKSLMNINIYSSVEQLSQERNRGDVNGKGL